MLAGVAVAYRQYVRAPAPATAPEAVSALTVAARRDLYGDAVNEAVFMRPGQGLVRALDGVESTGIDGSVTGAATGIGALSRGLRRLQTGFVRSYALYMFAGATVVVGALVLVTL